MDLLAGHEEWLNKARTIGARAKERAEVLGSQARSGFRRLAFAVDTAEKRLLALGVTLAMLIGLGLPFWTGTTDSASWEFLLLIIMLLFILVR